MGRQGKQKKAVKVENENKHHDHKIGSFYL